MEFRGERRGDNLDSQMTSATAERKYCVTQPGGLSSHRTLTDFNVPNPVKRKQGTGYGENYIDWTTVVSCTSAGCPDC